MDNPEWVNIRIIETKTITGADVPLKVGLISTPQGPQAALQVGTAGPPVILPDLAPAELIVQLREIVAQLHTSPP